MYNVREGIKFRVGEVVVRVEYRVRGGGIRVWVRVGVRVWVRVGVRNGVRVRVS